MSLSKTQQRVLDYLEVDPVISLEDTQTHGFRQNTLDSLVRKGKLVEEDGRYTVTGEVVEDAAVVETEPDVKPADTCAHARLGESCDKPADHDGNHLALFAGGSVQWASAFSD
jgi:hypothetical protein